jgi:hypothetical protein
MSQEKDLRVVIGAWRGLEDGYVAQAKQSGRAYFLPPPGVWDTLKAGLGEEGAALAGLESLRTPPPASRGAVSCRGTQRRSDYPRLSGKTVA